MARRTTTRRRGRGKAPRRTSATRTIRRGVGGVKRAMRGSLDLYDTIADNTVGIPSRLARTLLNPTLTYRATVRGESIGGKYMAEIRHPDGQYTESPRGYYSSPDQAKGWVDGQYKVLSGFGPYDVAPRLQWKADKHHWGNYTTTFQVKTGRSKSNPSERPSNWSWPGQWQPDLTQDERIFGYAIGHTPSNYAEPTRSAGIAKIREIITRDPERARRVVAQKKELYGANPSTPELDINLDSKPMPGAMTESEIPVFQETEECRFQVEEIVAYPELGEAVAYAQACKGGGAGDVGVVCKVDGTYGVTLCADQVREIEAQVVVDQEMATAANPSYEDDNASLIRHAQTARSVEELGRLWRYAVKHGDTGLKVEVERRAVSLGIRVKELELDGGGSPWKWGNPKRSAFGTNAKTLTLKKDIWLFHDRTSEHKILRAGEKVKVFWSAGTGFANVYAPGWGGAMLSATIKAQDMAGTFKKIPADWEPQIAQHLDTDGTAPNPVTFVRMRGLTEDEYKGLKSSLRSMFPYGLKINRNSSPIRVAKTANIRHESGLFTEEQAGQVRAWLLSRGFYGGDIADPSYGDFVFRQGFWYIGKRVDNTSPNPQPGADDLYESFHGTPTTETVIVRDEIHEHEYLATLGTLVEMWVDTPTGYRVHMQFDTDIPYLASSEDGRQLYIEGGDQSVDLAAFQMDGDNWVKDRMVLGQFSEPEPGATHTNKKRYWNIAYQTRKEFDKFEDVIYQHDLGEDTGDRPYLEYEPRNKKLYVAGGRYYIKQPLMGTSPGIEN